MSTTDGAGRETFEPKVTTAAAITWAQLTIAEDRSLAAMMADGVAKRRRILNAARLQVLLDAIEATPPRAREEG